MLFEEEFGIKWAIPEARVPGSNFVKFVIIKEMEKSKTRRIWVNNGKIKP